MPHTPKPDYAGRRFPNIRDILDRQGCRASRLAPILQAVQLVEDILAREVAP